MGKRREEKQERFGAPAARWLAVLVCLLGGCQPQEKMAGDEVAPAEQLQRAGAKLQTESIASNSFLISVTGVDFSDVAVGNAELAPAADLPFLRTVVLRGTKVTDAGLAVFKNCEYLETVNLSRTAVTGVGLHNLHRSLVKDLDLSDSKFGDPGTAELVEIGHHLLRLNLAGTQITDEGMERLEGLPALEVLNLARTRLLGPGLRFLPGELRQLNLSGSSIETAGLVHLDRLRGLEILDLSGCRVTDDAIPHIQAMTEAQNTRAGRRKFRFLNVRKTAVSAEAIATLKKAGPGLMVER